MERTGTNDDSRETGKEPANSAPRNNISGRVYDAASGGLLSLYVSLKQGGG